MFLFMVLKCWQVSTSLRLMSRSYFELGMVEPFYYSICGRFVFNCWASAAEEVCSPFKQLSKEWADGIKLKKALKKKQTKNLSQVCFFLFLNKQFLVWEGYCNYSIEINQIYTRLKLLNKLFVIYFSLFCTVLLPEIVQQMLIII